MNQRYYKAIEDALAEMIELNNQKKAIEAQMKKLNNLFAANLNMLPDEDRDRFIAQMQAMTPPGGLSEAVLRVLKIDGYLGALEVRDRLIEDGYDFTGQVNPLASIHTTLKRLVESDDAEMKVNKADGKTIYKRIGPLRKAGRAALAAKKRMPFFGDVIE